MKQWMEKKVLVLNLDHSPVGIVSVKKALVLTFLDKATSLASFEYLKIRTIDREFIYPAVIRLYEYKNIPYKGVMLNRNNLFRRDDHTCQYCGSDKDLTIDHVIPKSRGGDDSWENLVSACTHCNHKKGDQTPREAGMKLLGKPFRPNHIIYLRDFYGNVHESWKPYLYY